MVSPLHTSSLHPYSLPFFIPLYFACRRRPNPFHLFAPISIAMFSGLGFTPFFYLLFFGSLEGNFISVLLVMLSDFTDYIEYLLLVLLGSVVGICYIVRYKLNYCICRQTDFVGKRSLPLRLQQPDSSAPSWPTKPFTLLSFVLTFLFLPHGNISLWKLCFFSHIHIISIDLPANKCYNFLIPIPKRSARLWIINESEEF